MGLVGNPDGTCFLKHSILHFEAPGALKHKQRGAAFGTALLFDYSKSAVDLLLLIDFGNNADAAFQINLVHDGNNGITHDDTLPGGLPIVVCNGIIDAKHIEK